MVARPEFGTKAGKNMLVINSLCVFKIYGASFRSFLAETLAAMGYRTSYSDPDL